MKDNNVIEPISYTQEQVIDMLIQVFDATFLLLVVAVVVGLFVYDCLQGLLSRAVEKTKAQRQDSQ